MTHRRLIFCAVSLLALFASFDSAEAQRPPRTGSGQVIGGGGGIPPREVGPGRPPRPLPPSRGPVTPPRDPGRGGANPVPGQGAAPIDIQVAVTRMQGLGCPSGGASAIVSPDGQSVSILFDRMSTELSPGAPSTQKKQCLVHLGLSFSGPYRVAIVGSDARGFVSVPAGGQSTLSVQHYPIFTQDQRVLRRMNFTQTYVGPRSEDVILQSDFRDVPVWSYCGSQMRGRATMPLMQIGLSIESSNSNPNESLIAAIDSLDIGGGSSLTYHLMWTQDTRNCPR